MNDEEGAARRPISEIVAERIERLIVDGVLKVGQPLPSERRLCEKLGFSRSALREGLTVLRGRGIIETAQGRDSRVARLTAEEDPAPYFIFSARNRALSMICLRCALYLRESRHAWRRCGELMQILFC